MTRAEARQRTAQVKVTQARRDFEGMLAAFELGVANYHQVEVAAAHAESVERAYRALRHRAPAGSKV